MARLLDLFCGAGGAAVGYHRAGFDVVGVDIAPQPNYPFEFHWADAMTWPLDGFDAIHASPPCQAYSRGVVDKAGRPDLLPATRERLATAGAPWIIENVPGAPMRPDYRLCGCMFDDLPGLRRERWFETSWNGFALRPPCVHLMPTVTVVGHGPHSHSHYYRRVHDRDWAALTRRAMGIDWMNRDELSQAIPPAYTEWIGAQLLAHLEAAA